MASWGMAPELSLGDFDAEAAMEAELAALVRAHIKSPEQTSHVLPLYLRCFPSALPPTTTWSTAFLSLPLCLSAPRC